MPTKIIEDLMARFVRVEHTCLSGRATYWASTTLAHLGDYSLDWKQRGFHCQDCGERLPMNVAEAERVKET